MKKAISLLFAVLFCVALCACENKNGAVSSASETAKSEWKNTFRYTVNENGVTINRYLGEEENVNIPSTIEDKPVVCIGREAFLDLATLHRVDIPSTVTTIDARAFARCYYLETVTGAEKVSTVEEEAFAYASRLKTYPFTESLTRVGKQAFLWCEALESICIPASLNNIEERAFARCTGAKTLTFVDNALEYLGKEAFIECNGITELNYPYVSVSMGEGAFKHMRSLKTVTFDERVTKIVYCTFQHCEALEEVTVPEHITMIEGYAFGSCTGMKKLIIEGMNTLVGEVIVHQNKSVDYYVRRGGLTEETALAKNWNAVTVMEVIVDGDKTSTIQHKEDHLRYLD